MAELEKNMQELKQHWNELMKCLIHDTFIIKLIDKLGLELKERYK